jgi:hypothetical protein
LPSACDIGNYGKNQGVERFGYLLKLWMTPWISAVRICQWSWRRRTMTCQQELEPSLQSRWLQLFHCLQAFAGLDTFGGSLPCLCYPSCSKPVRLVILHCLCLRQCIAIRYCGGTVSLKNYSVLLVMMIRMLTTSWDQHVPKTLVWTIGTTLVSLRCLITPSTW